MVTHPNRGLLTRQRTDGSRRDQVRRPNHYTAKQLKKAHFDNFVSRHYRPSHNSGMPRNCAACVLPNGVPPRGSCPPLM